ncbi:mucin-2-like [Branchiostoma floridae]|uniref:Mucin-2-like n=1 Tax=Branchiostoma floridae TaxID=7739 RepID=A0A9J7N427_BRAFL|nr:mucin-2-like [Branchiostoma floridae]
MQCSCNKTCSMVYEECNEDNCEMGCYCPEGTYRDGSRCIPETECPCVYQGKTYASGGRWLANECTLCLCSDRLAFCTKKCDKTCAEDEELINPSGSQCCYCQSLPSETTVTATTPIPTTPISSEAVTTVTATTEIPASTPEPCSGCYVQGECLEVGSVWRSDPCTTCECESQGNTECTTIECAIPVCEDGMKLVYKPEQCCPVCDEHCPGQFPCNYTDCIPLSWECDGKADCDNGADEAFCETEIPPTPAPVCQYPYATSDCKQCLEKVCHDLKDTCQPMGEGCCECSGKSVFNGSQCVDPIDCTCLDDEGIVRMPKETWVASPCTECACFDNRVECESTVDCAAVYCDEATQVRTRMTGECCDRCVCRGFDCGDGQCLTTDDQKCNGVIDCANGSDEEDCEGVYTTVKPELATTPFSELTTEKFASTTTEPSAPGTEPTAPYPCEGEWTEWMNSFYPDVMSGGDYETFKNLRKKYDFCGPEMITNIQCRVDSALEMDYTRTGQDVTCDIHQGLVCENSKQRGFLPFCYNYKVRVFCECGGETTTSEGLTTGKPYEMTTGKPTETYTTGKPSETYTTGKPSEMTTGKPAETYTTGKPSETYTTGTPSEITTGKPSEMTTGEPSETYTTGKPSEMTTGKPSEIYTTGKPSEMTTGKPSEMTTGKPSETYTTSKPSEMTSGKPSETYTTGKPSEMTTGKPSEMTTGKPSEMTTGKPSETYTTGKPSETHTTGKPSEITTSSSSEITTSKQFEITTGKPSEVFTTGKPSEMTTGKPSEVYTTGEPSEVYTTGKPSGVTTGEPSEVYTTGKSSEMTTGKPSEVHTTGEYISTTTEPSAPGTEPTTPYPCEGEWTEWMNSFYPDVVSGGDYETFDNLRKKYDFCGPEMITNIECRVDSGLEMDYTRTGQDVTCDIHQGLVCENSKQRGFLPFCYNYKVRVFCECGGETTTSEGLTTGKPSEMTTGKPSETYTTAKPSETYTTGKPSETYTTGKPSEMTTGKPSEVYTTGKPFEATTGSLSESVTTVAEGTTAMPRRTCLWECKCLVGCDGNVAAECPRIAGCNYCACPDPAMEKVGGRCVIRPSYEECVLTTTRGPEGTTHGPNEKYTTGPYMPGHTTGPYVPGHTTGPYVPGHTTGPYVPGHTTGKPGTTGPYMPGHTTGPYMPEHTTGPYVPGHTTGPYVPGHTTGPNVPGHTTGKPGTTGPYVPEHSTRKPGTTGPYMPEHSTSQPLETTTPYRKRECSPKCDCKIGCDGSVAHCQAISGCSASACLCTEYTSGRAFGRCLRLPDVEDCQATTESPIVTTLRSESTEGLETTQGPSVTGRPLTTQESSATEKPSVTEKPHATEKPTGTEKPSATEPSATEKPSGTEGPSATEPTRTEKPSATEPTGTEGPSATESTGTEGPSSTETTETEGPSAAEPTGTEKPSATEPTGTEKPSATEPTGTEKPSATEPTGTEGPSATELPGTEGPSATEPTGTEKPSATEKPTGTEKPSGTEPNGTEKPSGTEPTGTEKPSATEPTGTDKPSATEPTGTEGPSATESSGTEEPSATEPTETEGQVLQSQPGQKDQVLQKPTGTEKPVATEATGTVEPTKKPSKTEQPHVEPTKSYPCEGEWTEWMNSFYPNVISGGDFETLDNLREKFDFCGPEMITNIECRVDSGLEMDYTRTGQDVTCDIHQGLVCENSKQRGFLPFCYDYKVRVFCECGGETTTSEGLTTVKPSEMNTGKPSEMTTGKPSEMTTGKPSEMTTGKPSETYTTGKPMYEGTTTSSVPTTTRRRRVCESKCSCTMGCDGNTGDCEPLPECDLFCICTDLTDDRANGRCARQPADGTCIEETTPAFVGTTSLPYSGKTTKPVMPHTTGHLRTTGHPEHSTGHPEYSTGSPEHTGHPEQA